MAKTQLLSEGIKNYIGGISTATKFKIGVKAGIAGAGGLAIAAGDYQRGKALSKKQKADSAEDNKNALIVAGAIATTGVATYGIAKAISNMR
jgi:hypothetical protein